MSEITLLGSLQDNKSIKIVESVSNWQEAIRKTFEPLLKNGSVKQSYIDSVISSTTKFGPYYIISDDIAMPHSRPEDGAIKDSFSLLILKKPVVFEKDDRKVSVLIGLAATSDDIHVSFALPQVVATFENKENVSKIMASKTIEDVEKILLGIDSSKYLD